MRTVQVIVDGLVQGVWFRDCTRREAARLGLSGWVRNLPSGAVEALISGGEEEVSAMLDWLRTGSPRSRVDRLYTRDLESAKPPAGFFVRYD
jgi:acylphosphatase